MKTKNTITLSAIGLIMAMSIGVSKAAHAQNHPPATMTRAEVVSEVVDEFDLKKRNEVFISNCLANPGDCFFAFSAMSGFDKIGFNPLRLYPDVDMSSTYADDVHTVTMLGIARGYLGEKNMPFKPNANMTKIEALKVVMASAGLLQWKERFELVLEAENQVFKDIIPGDQNSWWYDRYARFALEANVIDQTDFFHPNDYIEKNELEDMIKRAKIKAE